MNESLAKQLHKLVDSSMWSVKSGIDEILSDESDRLEDNINKLIEETTKEQNA